MNNRDEFFSDFLSDPARDVFIIDEIRPNRRGDQYAIFGLVATKVSILRDAQAEWYEIASKSELQEIVKNEIKGSYLYGTSYHDELKPFKEFFERWIRKIDKLYFMYTSQNNIALNKKTSSGRMRIEENGITYSAGAEFEPIIHFIKRAANEMKIGPKKVEVILDEAEQNSAGAIEFGKVKASLFQSFNTVQGGMPATYQCASEFRIIRTPDQTPDFQHVLLLADATCYLAEKYTLLDGKMKVDDDLFHFQEMLISDFLNHTLGNGICT